MTANMDVEHEHWRTLELAERIMSIFSLLGCFFIIGTFLTYPSFRKPINRLVMFASLGNILCNVATLISTIPMEYGGAICRFQAYLIQMFMPADSLWTLCMALNVYLTFFKGYNSGDLRLLEKWYFVFCYGVPFLPALIFLLIDDIHGKDIYGPATLWCWISPEWDWMRIAFFYGPVWLVIMVSIFIYVKTGNRILKQRAALRYFAKDQKSCNSPSCDEFLTCGECSNCDIADATKVTEVNISSESIGPKIQDTNNPTNLQRAFRRSNVQQSKIRKFFKSLLPSSRFWRNPFNSARKCFSHNLSNKENVHDQNLYTSCTATILTGEDIIPTSKSKINAPAGSKIRTPPLKINTNSAACGYAKVALLMFVAMVIVWVPSTINRVYAFVKPETPIFAFNVLAASVLPLQGFWNSLIYLVTSWAESKDAFKRIVDGRFGFKRVKRARSTSRASFDHAGHKDLGN